MEDNNYNDFMQECYEFFERMSSKYDDIIEINSKCLATKRVERKSVPSFNDMDYKIQSSPVMEVSIKFNVLAYGANSKSNHFNNSSSKLMAEWISTKDDLPCNHPEMCYETSVKGGVFTHYVLVRTKDNTIFACDMRKESDGSIIWNVLPKSTVITHWARIPKFD